MSDAPLFQNADEQEAAYAPQQRPDFVPHPTAGSDHEAPPIAGIAPTTAGAFEGPDQGPALSNLTANPGSGVSPAYGATAAAAESEDESARR